jgi:hypothetical protein
MAAGLQLQSRTLLRLAVCGRSAGCGIQRLAGGGMRAAISWSRSPRPKQLGNIRRTRGASSLLSILATDRRPASLFFEVRSEDVSKLWIKRVKRNLGRFLGIGGPPFVVCRLETVCDVKEPLEGGQD